MYNSYIPQDSGYAPVTPSAESARQSSRSDAQGSEDRAGSVLKGLLGAFGGKGTWDTGKVKDGLKGLLKSFHLEDLDLGDILLALIVLLIILEDGDNLDLVITLGLMILFSLGER